MDDGVQLCPPATLWAIERDTAVLGFTMASDAKTGSLLRTLAASKPGGKLLELGTGTGIATAWLLDGMDAASSLLTVNNDEAVIAVARKHLGHDTRVTFRCQDGVNFLQELQGQTFDFIFADTWPGKYDGLDLALRLLKRGGLYVIDDMLPQANWPAGHDGKAASLLTTLGQKTNLFVTKLHWSSGVIVATKR